LLVVALVSRARVRDPARVGGSIPRFATRKIFLIAAEKKQEIAASLQAPGFELGDRLVESDFLLRMTLGNGDFRSCGTFHNVEYSLRRGGQELLQITRAGWRHRHEPRGTMRSRALLHEVLLRPLPFEGPPSARFVAASVLILAQTGTGGEHFRGPRQSRRTLCPLPVTVGNRPRLGRSRPRR
jgi:hypothetical protein